MIKISAVCVIRNEAENLVDYFNHVKLWADEIIVVDQQSTDNSLELALEFADKVFISKKIGYKELDRDFARQQARNDWITELDPDERFESKFIANMQLVLERCERDKCDGILLKNVGYWSGIRVVKDDHDKMRINKKNCRDNQRCHTSVSPDLALVTSYKIYHLKDLNTAIQEEEWRSDAYKNDVVKKKIIDNIKLIINEAEISKENWKLKLKTINNILIESNKERLQVK